MIIKPRKLIKIEDELWREVPESNNCYQVSNYGRVKSFAYNQKDGQILKTHIIKGFKTIHLNLDKKPQTSYLHKLVAEIWISKPSSDYTFVTHLDGNMINNHVSNLAWMTKEMLKEHHRELRQKNGFGKPKTQINNSKLKERDVVLLKSMLQRGVTQASIAKMFCISEMQVTRIKRGENWGHVQPE
jgi:hypothetical protein